VDSFMFWPIYPQGKSPQYPLDSRMGRLQSQSGCNGKEKYTKGWYRELPCYREVNALACQ